jgi:ubiquinone/menaquinone biosynthesis C-methylase UbiE
VSKFWILIPVLLLLGLAYWELWVCEGTHLGRRFVIWLYDLAARRYDGIKQFDTMFERRFLGEPIAVVLGSMADPLVLDVGAGTGRLARSLFQLPEVAARLVCIEASARMLDLGRSHTPDRWTRWLLGWAVPLPFASETFDLVASLEMLEFTPRPRETLQEMARVLRRGGWMLVTNRVGPEARWILGKTWGRERFAEVLRSIGLADVEVFPWQVDYDLAWARKP